MVIYARTYKIENLEQVIQFLLEISGGLRTPIGMHMYQYFPHGSITAHRLLVSLLVRIW